MDEPIPKTFRIRIRYQERSYLLRDGKEIMAVQLADGQTFLGPDLDRLNQYPGIQYTESMSQDRSISRQVLKFSRNTSTELLPALVTIREWISNQAIETITRVLHKPGADAGNSEHSNFT